MKSYEHSFKPFCTGNLLISTLANSEDQDEMQHNAAFHLGLYCCLRLKQSSGKEIHNNLEKFYLTLKCTVDIPLLIV